MRGHLPAGVLRHPVENEGERRPAVARRTEELPRHRVGVAGGGRDEEPSVGRREELAGERAVLGEDGVDVGRVEEGEPLRKRLRRRELQRPRLRLAAARPRQAGQDARALEPLEVVRVEGEHRRARRRAQDACRAHDRPDEAVQERRLPGPRRAADDDERRRVHLPQPREEIVVHLRDEVVPRAPCLFRPRHREVEADGLQVVAQAAEGRWKVRCHIYEATPRVALVARRPVHREYHTNTYPRPHERR